MKCGTLNSENCQILKPWRDIEYVNGTHAVIQLRTFVFSDSHDTSVILLASVILQMIYEHWDGWETQKALRLWTFGTLFNSIKFYVKFCVNHPEVLNNTGIEIVLV